jgi:hypothetical protein
MSRNLKLGFGVALALLLARPAFADVIETFTLNDNGGIVSGNDVGTVKLDQINADQVQVTVTMNSAVVKDLIKTGNGSDNHPTFGFSLSGDPAIAVTAITAGFGLDPQFNGGSHTYSTSGSFGTFDYAINDTNGQGGSHGLPGPLVFDVGLSGGGAFSISNFVKNSDNFWFVADILGQNGKTGLVAALPEAPTPLFFGAGLLGLIALCRRRSVKPAHAN